MIEDRFLNQNNFHIAFKKLNYLLSQSNEWYNPIELSSYEATLSNNFQRLIDQIKSSEYSPKPLQAIPFPKKSKDGKKRLRQYFRVSLDDQLVWIAIANVIAQFVENEMPVWNYGNRLFRPVWYDQFGKHKSLRKGSYLNTSENMYRRWNQSWPIYRRHINMSIKLMGYNRKFKIDHLSDDREVEIYKGRNVADCYYLNKDFWKSGKADELYWAGLDFKSFYPSIRTENVINNIREALTDSITGNLRTDCHLIMGLVEKMMTYPLDLTGWKDQDDLTDENKLGLKDIKIFTGVPTGLFAAGFLANTAMIKVDRKLDAFVKKKRTIAIFKYVDDHVILSKTNEDLLEFLNLYHELLKDTGVAFQDSKIFPKNQFDYSDDGFSLKSDSYEANIINIQYPKPLMTQTLQKMSAMNAEDFELSDNDQLDKVAADMEHFLLADFSDEEIRKDTRTAFAATKLCQIASQMTPDFKDISSQLADSRNVKKKSKGALSDLTKIISRLNSKVKKRQQRIFKLLLKAALENPDKLKLWKRCIELCFVSGLNAVGDVFTVVDTVDLHEGSKTYIKFYCLMIVDGYLLRSKNILQSDKRSFWRYNTATEFLNNSSSLIVLPKIKSNFPFSLETYTNHKIIPHHIYSQSYKPIELGTHYAPKYKYKEESLRSFYNRPENSNSHLFEEYVWYLLNNTYGLNKLTLWNSEVLYLDLNKAISWSIIVMYPKEISSDLYKKILAKKKSTSFNCVAPNEYSDLTSDGEGISYEIFQSSDIIRKKYLKSFYIIEDVLKKGQGDFVHLDQWLTKVVEQTKNNVWIDVRLSEWTIIEIIKQISQLIKRRLDESNPFDSIIEVFRVHPANYLIPISWANERKKLTWDDWKFIVKDQPIKLSTAKVFIYDFRYGPIKDLWRQDYSWVTMNQFSIVIGLSVLLTKLLAKDFQWPVSSNKLAFIDNLFSMAKTTIEHQPISSDTRILLSRIFSKGDYDFLTGYSQSDDTDMITSLDKLIKELTDIQEILEKHHLTLIDNSPRQLTFIDIDKINEAKSIF